jgi:glycosyltransferase involved in cell wall biosynthesis
MITVLHLAESGGWAGGETYLLSLARRLDRKRFRLIVASPEPGALTQNLQAMDVETLVWDMGQLGSVGPILRLRGLLREQGVHILQSHGARSNFLGRIAGRLAGTPGIISTVHNSLYDYPVGAFRKALYLFLDRLSAPLAHRVLCVAESHRQELIRRYHLSPGTVVTIPNGVDLERFHPARYGRHVRKEFEIPGEAFLLGIIGRLTPQKGHVYLLRALRLLSVRFPLLRCLIVGDGESRKDLMQLATDPGLAGRCLFAGVRHDIQEVLSALDLLVIPSLSEGLPYVALEGMAMAKPIVATAVNGLPELIRDGETGRLVPKGDPHALAEAIGEVLSDTRRAAALGQAARLRVEREYSIELWVQRLERLYDGLR